jgi:hypothetical protein
MKLCSLVPDQSLEDFKQSFVPDADEHPWWAESLQMMYTLIVYLEEMVSGTDKFVVKQLTNLTLKDPNSDTTTHISAWNSLYQIECYRSGQDSPVLMETAATPQGVVDVLEKVWIASSE